MNDFLANRLSKGRMSFLWFSAIYGMLSKYRTSILGPLWLMIGPAIMISLLGILLSSVTGTPREIYVPHLGLGMIVWSLISALIVHGSNLFEKHRGFILTGTAPSNIVIVHVLTSFLTFLHVMLLIIPIWILFFWQISSSIFISIFGIGIILLNGGCFAWTCSTLSMFFKDIPPLIGSVVGALFFITPIIWMPNQGGRSKTLDMFLDYNPFYHLLELVRAPILGSDIDPKVYFIALAITTSNLLIATLLYFRFNKEVAKWV